MHNTTQADENNSDKKDEKKTEHAKTESAKDSTKESASQGTTQTETLYSKEANTVTVKFENVIYGTAAAGNFYIKRELLMMRTPLHFICKTVGMMQ